jgi:Domain of unknown function (DUF5060)
MNAGRALFTFILFSTVVYTACSKTEQVGKWERFELVFHENTKGNPFSDVELGAVFSSPDGKDIKVYGFYDGDGMGAIEGDVYKIRFAPSVLGKWRYRTFSNQKRLNGLEGAFLCAASGQKGPLVRDPENPWYLKWADGGFFFESGANDPEAFLASGFSTQQERKEELDYLASAGVNILYFGMVNAGPGDGGPGEKVTPWRGGFDSPDFDTICLDFMNRLEEVLDHMAGLDLVAHVVFYLDDCGGISNTITEEQEELWFRYTSARFGSYPNLIWNLAEEYEEQFDIQWCESRAAWLKKYDQLKHPVTVHQLSADNFALAGSPDFDLTALQFNFTDPDSLNDAILKVRNQVEQAGRPVPVSLIEWTPIDADQADLSRKGIWAITMAGGTYQIFNKNRQGPVKLDFSRWEAHWRDAAILKNLMESLPFERMYPDNSLVSNGYCLALPGTCYLIYQPECGELIFKPGQIEKTMYAYLVDPREGRMSRHRHAGRGAGEIMFSTPDSSDWALLVVDSPRDTLLLLNK